MDKLNNSYSFLTIGKTVESTEASEGFKRYVGLASSYVLAVNPSKAELEKIYGREIASEPEYTVEDEERGKGVRVDFIVKTDPDANKGIEIISKASFMLLPAPCYNRDKSKVRVIDDYGNSTWMNTEDAKAGKLPLTSKGAPARIDSKYRMAFVGEADITDFLRKYLFNKDSFRMVNGVWTKQADADDVKIRLDKPKELFAGNIGDIKDAVALQPNNKIKLLYGVKTKENKQYQSVCAAYDMMLRNNSGANALPGLEKNLASAKNAGMYSTIDYRVQELQEYVVEPTNLTPDSSDLPFSTSASADDDLPW